ncbi:hypothetical protein, partial [Propionicimonas sp.]|uniref:beta-xylosidase family glycoside hydrolase n=1 Tax=Propionicimonas sp. TaxID=1955623 RepID=UPI0039E5712F
DPRWTTLRGPGGFATPAGDGWRVELTRESLTGTGTPAFLGVRQQHENVDVRVAVRAVLRPGEEAGLVVRQSEADHVRLALTSRDAGVVARAVHRRAGAESVLGELRPGAAPGAAVDLGLVVRGQDYTLTVDGRTVATADGRMLDSIATGGFLGLWLGVYGTTNGGPTGTAIQVGPFRYIPV